MRRNDDAMKTTAGNPTLYSGSFFIEGTGVTKKGAAVGNTFLSSASLIIALCKVSDQLLYTI
jgi:hypothetical protein